MSTFWQTYSVAKINKRSLLIVKRYLKEIPPLTLFTSRHLLVQSQQWKHENICSKLTIKTSERRHFFANMILSRTILDHLRWTGAGLPHSADWCSFSKFGTWLFYKTESRRNRARASSQWCWRFLFEVEMIIVLCQIS